MLATFDTFPERRYLVPVNGWHELLWFLRNKRDAVAQFPHILDVASSYVKSNRVLIINTHHVLVSFIYANLFQGLSFVIFSKWIISYGLIGLEKKRQKKPVITYVSGQSGERDSHSPEKHSTVNPCHEHISHFVGLQFSSNPKDPCQLIWVNFARNINLNHGLWEVHEKKVIIYQWIHQATTQ